MKFLKTKNISKFSVSDNAYIQYPSGRIVVDSANSIRLPKGTTSQRPESAVLSNGMLRYNTSSGAGANPATTAIGLEIYHDGVWKPLRLKGPSTITKQTLGPGNATETKFGPLTFVPASADNIIVLVENVIQISTTNFTLVTNPMGYPTGTYLNFLSAVPFGKEVTVYYGFDQ